MVAISDPKRKSGISILGDAPWGTHFCHFYHTKEDLIDILVPYFKTGLENNEFCMWVTSEPFAAEEARAELQKAVEDLDQYNKKGQIEILDFSQWYTRSGRFDADKVLQGWVDKEQQARKNGFEGLRLTGNTFWIEHKDWKSFSDYEATINNVIHNYKMLAACSYSLDKCDAHEILDVFSTHQFALINRNGKWVTIESTERKRAEEELHESEERYRTLVEAAPDVIYTVSAEDGSLSSLNPAFETLTGWSRTEWLGKPVAGIVHPDDLPVAIETFQKALWGETQPRYELRVLSKSGEYLVGEFTSTPHVKDGRVVGELGIARDITERKRVEEALRESEDRYRDLVEHSQDLLCTHDLEGRLLSVNRAAARTLGYDPNEMVRSPIRSFLAPEFQHEFDDYLTRIRNAGRDHGLMVVQTRGGEKRIWEYSNTLRTEGVPAPMVRGLAHDVTERRKAEKALQKTNETLQALISASPIAIMTLDADGNVLLWNPAAERMFGWAEAEVLGRFNPLVPEDRIAEHYALRESVLKGEMLTGVELQRRKKDGTLIDVSFSTAPIHDSRGRVEAAMALLEDITERKRAEEALRHQNEMQQTILDSIPVMIAFLDREGRPHFVNRCWQSTLGWSLEEVQHKDILAEMYPDPAYREYVRDYIAAAAGTWGDFKTRTRGGHMLDTSWANVPLSDGSNIGIGIDVTERKRAEQALQESEEKYRRLFSYALDAILILDKESHRFLDANEAATRLYGYTYEELLGMRPEELSAEPEKTTAAIHELDQTGSIRVPLRWHRKKDGTVFPVEVSAWPFAWKGRRVSSVFMHDITERKQAEEALRESEERFRSLYEDATIGMYRTTPNGRILMANPTLVSMLGFDSFEGLVTRNLEREGFEPSYPRSQFRERLEREGQVSGLEAAWTRHDGSVIFVRESARAVRGDDGTVQYYEGTVEDITDRKQAEESIRRLSGRLLRLQDEERRRIARELHDTTAQSLAALAINLSRVKESATFSDPAASGCLSESLELAEQCSREIRTLSYLLHPPLLEEAGLASALRWYTRGFAQRSGIEVQLEIPPELGRLPDNVELALYRIVQECLANVHIHSQSKTACIRLTHDSHQIVLTVADAGRGIPPEVLERATAYAPELGVGIPGMRERVRELRGQLEVSSGRQGTTVTAILPLG